jgi:hypothetical protein
MSSAPAVIVNKGGFLSSLAKGVFGVITTAIVCGTALGLYGMYMADKNFGRFAQQVFDALPHWQQVLPPALFDAVNDRRAPEYRQSLDIATRYVPGRAGSDSGVLVLDIENKGPATVSLLALRLVIEDESRERFFEMSKMAASPLPFADPGPIQPGSARRIIQRLGQVKGEPKTTVEVCELRIWNGPSGPAEAAPSSQPQTD